MHSIAILNAVSARIILGAPISIKNYTAITHRPKIFPILIFAA